MSETNGCGAMKGWLSWVRPPHHHFFYTQCVLHDELYTIGGTEQDRKKADKRLFNDMVKHSLEYFTEDVASQWWFITLSFLYWIGVRLFGRGSFNYN